MTAQVHPPAATTDERHLFVCEAWSPFRPSEPRVLADLFFRDALPNGELRPQDAKSVGEVGGRVLRRYSVAAVRAEIDVDHLDRLSSVLNYAETVVSPGRNEVVAVFSYSGFATQSDAEALRRATGAKVRMVFDDWILADIEDAEIPIARKLPGVIRVEHAKRYCIPPVVRDSFAIGGP